MVKRAIKDAIKAVWPEYPVSIEAVRQNMNGPHFVILDTGVNHNTRFHDAQEVRCNYAVYYYPPKNEKREDIIKLGFALCQALELIQYEGLGYWAQKREQTIVDHVLIVTVSYIYRYRFIEDVDLMETLQHSISMGDEKDGK